MKSFLDAIGLARVWSRMCNRFATVVYVENLLDVFGCSVTIYCNGDGNTAIRVLSEDSRFDFGTVSRMWLDGVEMNPARLVVFGDTAEHAVRIQFDNDSVPPYAFYACDKLTAITFDAMVKRLGVRSFQGTVIVSRIVALGDELPVARSVDAVFGDSQLNMCCSTNGARISRVHASRSALSAMTDGWTDLAEYVTFKPILVKHPFSVSSGKTISFASSNLQYVASREVFTFGTWQGEMFGKQGGNETAPASRGQSSQPIDLFGWGCSGGEYEGYHRHFKPYDCVYYGSASSYAYYYGIVYGSSNYSYSLDGTGADWGVANRIPGEIERTGWRTLTANEWSYLWGSRANAASRRAKGKVGGVKGLILLPDDWALPAGVSLVTDVSATTTFASNTFTLEEWQVLEDAGAVFLPAAGYRSAVTASSAIITADNYTGSGKPTVGDADHSGNPVGSYWSTTYYGSTAYRFYFANGSTTTRSSASRYTGYAVRLVRDL